MRKTDRCWCVFIKPIFIKSCFYSQSPTDIYVELDFVFQRCRRISPSLKLDFVSFERKKNSVWLTNKKKLISNKAHSCGRNLTTRENPAVTTNIKDRYRVRYFLEHIKCFFIYFKFSKTLKSKSKVSILTYLATHRLVVNLKILKMRQNLQRSMNICICICFGPSTWST